MSETAIVPSAGTDACTLPSANSAADVVNGRVGALPTMVFHLLGRAALLGVGLYAAGMRRQVVRYSLAGAASIEVFVVSWMALQRYRRGWTTPGEAPSQAVTLTRGEVAYVGVLSAVVLAVGVAVAWREYRQDRAPQLPDTV